MGELFTLTTKGKRMSKVIVGLGYRSIVLDADKAIAIAELMTGAEVYESKWHSKTDTQDSYNSYHIYPVTQDHAFTMQLLTDDAYRMYKLSGKPQD